MKRFKKVLIYIEAPRSEQALAQAAMLPKRNQGSLRVIDDGRGGLLEEAFFETTDLHLLPKCPCPVWIVKSEGSSRFERVLAAVDTTSDEREQGALTRKILELGSSLAESHGAEFHVSFEADLDKIEPRRILVAHDSSKSTPTNVDVAVDTSLHAQHLSSGTAATS